MVGVIFIHLRAISFDCEEKGQAFNNKGVGSVGFAVNRFYLFKLQAQRLNRFYFPRRFKNQGQKTNSAKDNGIK